MFDLEASIIEWRQQMLAGRALGRPALEELEGHLREEVARRVSAGADLEAAFMAAIQTMGGPEALRMEFAKSAEASNTALKGIRFLWAFGLMAVIVGFIARTAVTLQLDWAWEAAILGVVILVTGVMMKWGCLLSVFPQKFWRGLKAVWPACRFYAKMAGLLLPAALVWSVAVHDIFPKVQEMCYRAHLRAFDFNDNGVVITLWSGLCEVMIWLTAHAGMIVAGLATAFILLEWRSAMWLRNRRAIVGTGIFAFNFAVLLSITLMMINTVIAASFFMVRAK
jgi:hypothetical protein